MKLAITDACIFIDLHDLQLTSHFFSLQIEVHTSVDVFNELYDNQKQVLSAFQVAGKLTVHNINERDRKVIRETSYPKSLSESDKSVLFLAVRHNAMVISSDKTVRNTAKSYAIEYHGMIWIFDQLIEKSLLSKQEAAGKLTQLVSTNIVYHNNKELIQEVNKRMNSWNN